MTGFQFRFGLNEEGLRARVSGVAASRRGSWASVLRQDSKTARSAVQYIPMCLRTAYCISLQMACGMSVQMA